jgi:hypothetical protein
MCDKCDKLDKKIEHYQSLMAMVPDPLTVERVEELIKQMQAQKVELHPEQA